MKKKQNLSAIETMILLTVFAFANGAVQLLILHRTPQHAAETVVSFFITGCVFAAIQTALRKTNQEKDDKQTTESGRPD